MNYPQIINKLYKKYIWDESLESYLIKSKKSKIWDEEKITDSLFELMLRDKNLWNYSKDNVLLQQQTHKTLNAILKPDFETNNEFCKTAILFDAKSSNISHKEMISWNNTVYENTFKKYLLNIKPTYKYIIWFNLEYIILYTKSWENDIKVLADIDVKKILSNDLSELKRFEELLKRTKYEELNSEDKIQKLITKEIDKDSKFSIDLFIEKFKNTQNWLYNFYLERLETIWFKNIPDEISWELEEFKDSQKDFFIQLANRLTLIEFFKYIFIRTYEDFWLIHKIDDNTTVPVTFWESISKISYENLDDFMAKYIEKINKVSFKDIWEEFFSWFSSLFNKYENFISDYILTWDSKDNEFDKEYNNRIFDVLFFLNEFNFIWLESEWDDIIWRLYETSLERSDRKRFWQFYTPRYIIDFILGELKIIPKPETKIVDLSCWTWGFLMKYLSKINLNILMNEDETSLNNIFEWTYWIDIKMFSTLLTKLNLALIFIIKNKFLIEKECSTHKLDTKNIINNDWLEINKSEDKKLEKWSFDYVVWNPPYVWIKWNADIVSRVKIDPVLWQYFTKRADLYYFFIIHWIEKLKVWWKLWYIFPREWITADFANKLREYILNHTKIIKLIDLNWISIFEDAWTTSCMLFLEKVEKKSENNSFDFIQFKDFNWKNIIKYIDENSEKLQTRTTENKKQKISSWFEIFSKKIISSNNFNKIIEKIKQGNKFDISLLKDLSSNVLFLNDFLDIKEIKKSDLSDKPWILWKVLESSNNLVKISDLFKISQWIVTWCDSVSKSHYEKWLASENQVWRGIFILEEEKEIRWIWLDDIRNKKENIWKIELNLYENWWWVELNNDEKNLIKPLYSWISLNTWNINKNKLWVIYNNPADSANLISVKNYTWTDYDNHIYINNYSIIYKYLFVYINILKNRSPINSAPYWKKWHYLNIDKFKWEVRFEESKILTNTKTLWFTYTDKPAYWNWWWQWWLNYIFIDEKNKYTKIIDEKTSRADYLKFTNAMLNSKVIIDYLKENKFNSLSWEKLKELKIPKINFNDEIQVEKYQKVVSLSNKLIDIYSDKKNSVLNELIIRKAWKLIVEIWSDEYYEIIKSKDFEIIDDNNIFYIKIWITEYFWFDDFKDKFEDNNDNSKAIWEILWINESKNNSEEIKEINNQIDELANWFYSYNWNLENDNNESNQINLLV